MPDISTRIRNSEKKIKAEMPDVASRQISPAGTLGKFFSRGAVATTNPFTGNVSYNPDMMANMSDDEIDNTLAHELTHSRQIKRDGLVGTILNMMKPDVAAPPNSNLLTKYHWQPRELEAFQTEKDRTLNKKLNTITTDPMTGQRDIQLSSTKKK